MLPLALALGTAASYGVADFLGGLASRRSPAARVLLAAHGTGLVCLLVLLLLLPPATPLLLDLAWAAGGATLGVVGLTCLYRGLAGGPMAIVSSVSGVLSAVVPLAVGLASGERLGPPAQAGVALGLVATVLVSLGPVGTHAAHRDARWLTVVLSVVAGAGIGASMAALAQCSDGAGLWPLVTSRAVSTGLLLLTALAAARSLRPAALLPHCPVLAASAGALDTLGTGLFLAAASFGSLGVVAVLAAQYPAATVALARVRLGERLVPRQVVGVACALAAVALLAV